MQSLIEDAEHAPGDNTLCDRDPSKRHTAAARVVPDGLSIAYHETAHMLVMHDPSAPRNRGDLPPDEDAQVWANSATWLPDGFADYVSYEIAGKLHIVPADLFGAGKSQSEVDAHAKKWLNDPRGRAVLPFIASHGSPDNWLATVRTSPHRTTCSATRS